MDSYIEKENIFCIFLKFDALKQYTYQKKFFLNLSKNILLRFTLLTFLSLKMKKKKKLQKGIHQR